MRSNKRVNIQRRSTGLSSGHDVRHEGSIAQKHPHPSSTSSDRLAHTSVSTAAMVVSPEATQPAHGLVRHGRSRGQAMGAAKRSRHVHARTGLTARRALQSDTRATSARWRVGIQCEVEGGVCKVTALAHSGCSLVCLHQRRLQPACSSARDLHQTCVRCSIDPLKGESVMQLCNHFLVGHDHSNSLQVSQTSSPAIPLCKRKRHVQAMHRILEFSTVVPSRTTGNALWRSGGISNKNRREREEFPTESNNNQSQNPTLHFQTRGSPSINAITRCSYFAET